MASKTTCIKQPGHGIHEGGTRALRSHDSSTVPIAIQIAVGMALWFSGSEFRTTSEAAGWL